MPEFNWNYYVTRPMMIRAIIVGGENFAGPGVEPGDYLIENPDPLERADAPLLHCPREEFLLHYEAIEDAETSEEVPSEGESRTEGGKE